MSHARTFRLFVSSTFTDLKAERNALQAHVFPRLKRFCRLRDSRFQDIDLRWGISEEAGLDQRTMRICLQEVARCQEATPRPNFVVLLGDRYGWRPLPFEIGTAELAAVRSAASPAELALLERWYELDDNAVPPVHRLQPRQRGSPEEGYETWRTRVEEPLLALLRRVRPDYEASATEHEIVRGALDADADRHVFAFFRSIDGFPATGAGELRDLRADGTPDRAAAERLTNLKNLLRTRLAGNVETYSANWLPAERRSAPPDAACERLVDRLYLSLRELLLRGEPLDEQAFDRLRRERDERVRQAPASGFAGGDRPPEPAREASPITLDHLPALCADVFLRLGWTIARELAAFAGADAVEEERRAHREFGSGRSRHFIGRRAALDAIDAYLDGSAHGEERIPLAVVGEPGSGKTALLAHAADRLALRSPGVETIVRFVGATAESADGRALLAGLCRDIARRYGGDESQVPKGYRALARELPDRLAVASPARPLALFLDALDMLAATDRADALGWLPRRLPPFVSLVVSTTPGDGQAAVERRLGAGHFVALDTLSLREGARLLRRWLADAGRRLTRRQRRIVLEGFAACRLPLYLKLAFDAAREWPSSATPEALGPAVTDLVESLLARLSDDGQHGERMLSRSLAYLAAARHGLTEDEILDLLSRDAEVMQAFRERAPDSPAVERLPVVVWSRLFHDLQFYLARQRADGTTVLTFYHQQVRRVAEAAYLGGERGAARHADLARYYEDDSRLAVEGAGRRAYNLRKLAEQPFQQTLAGRWNELAATLGGFDFLQAKVESGEGFDAVADFERARTRFPAASRFDDDPHARSREILDEFSSAFNQEAGAFLAHPESTAQQIYNNLFAHTGFAGVTGELLRAFVGPRDGGAAWLRRLNRSPGTSTPRSLQRTLAPHAAEVTALAVSADGRWIASGSRDGEIRVLARADGSEVAGFRTEGGAVAGLAWLASDGEQGPLRLVSAARSGRLTVWDWESERPEPGGIDVKTQLRALVALPGGRVAFAGDDRVVATWRPGDPGPTRRYNHQDRVLCLTAARRSERIASGGGDRTVRLWTDGRPLPPLKGHERAVRAIAMAPEADWGVSGDDAGVVRSWSVADARERRVIRAHAHRVNCLGVAAAGSQILSGSADTTIKVWDAASGQPLATLRAHARPVTCLATDPDGEWFVSAGEDETVRLWRTETERRRAAEELSEHEAAITTLVGLADGRIASASEDATIRLWTPAGEAEMVLRGHVAPITCLLADTDRLLSGSADRTIRSWRLDGSRRVDSWGGSVIEQAARLAGGATAAGDGHSRTVTRLVRAPGDRILSAGEDGAFRAWDTGSGRPAERYEPVTGALSDLVALDGWLAGAGTPREITVWPLGGGAAARRLTGHESSVSSLVALGGDRLASGGLDGAVWTWSATSGEGAMRWRHAARVHCLAADRASGRLASAADDGTVLLGAIAGGPPRPLVGHTGPVRVLAFVDGALVSGDDEGWIYLWSADGDLPAVIVSVGSSVTALLSQPPDRLWLGTRGATVALLELALNPRRH